MPDYEIYKLHLQHKKQLEVELNDPSITEKEKRNYHSSLLEIDTKISRHEGIINTKALIDLLFDKIDSYRKLGLDKLAVFLEKCIIEIGIAECSPEEVKKWCVEQCKKVNPNLYDRATILPDVSFGGNIPTFPQASLDDVKLYGRRSLLKQIKEATIYNLEYQSTTQSSKLSLN